mmetsp:Transcript_22388/g.69396  ORF Transcript_22388/g.69396 Transcript_22388/m.69396 type:complete len:279 (-) Transcript_22388:33-869(-)
MRAAPTASASPSPSTSTPTSTPRSPWTRAPPTSAAAPWRWQRASRATAASRPWRQAPARRSSSSQAPATTPFGWGRPAGLHPRRAASTRRWPSARSGPPWRPSGPSTSASCTGTWPASTASGRPTMSSTSPRGTPPTTACRRPSASWRPARTCIASCAAPRTSPRARWLPSTSAGCGGRVLASSASCALPYVAPLRMPNGTGAGWRGSSGSWRPGSAGRAALLLQGDERRAARRPLPRTTAQGWPWLGKQAEEVRRALSKERGPAASVPHCKLRLPAR